MLFNFMHYAIRPWPWIIVALASLVIYPDLTTIHQEFPGIDPTYLKDDIAYPVMMSKLGPGWLGLIVASLIAAYMSTIGTHLNWGSSYLVNDFYKRFVKKDATEKELVRMGRISTVVLMLIAGTFALTIMDNATQAFNILLLTGAGSGAIYLLRWFWWRINAWTEIVAMIVATVQALILVLIVPDEAVATAVLDGFTIKLLIAVAGTTIAWLLTTLLTRPEDKATLRHFYRVTRPGGPGWKKVVEEARADGDMIDEKDHGKKWEMPLQILCVFIGCVVIYAFLFAIGSFVYKNVVTGVVLSAVALLGTWLLFTLFNKLRAE